VTSTERGEHAHRAGPPPVAAADVYRAPARAFADLGRRVSADLAHRWSALPPWAQALVVLVVSRLYAYVLVERTARFQPQSVWSPANPGYLDVVSLWDGDWYRRIAESGYPAELPRNELGQVTQNQWAFYPLFPAVARGLMTVTGASWQVAASLLALACAAAAAVLMRSLLDPLVGRRLALWTVVLFCAFPSAPVLQLAYTESLAVLLLLAVLWCLQRQRYLLAVPVVLLVGVARPIGVPVAVVVGLHLVRALWRHGVEPVTRSRLASMLVLVASSGVAAVAWPVIAYLGTGERAAYTDTMSAWRVGHQIELLRPWLNISAWVLGRNVGPTTVVLTVVALGVWICSRRSAVIGWDLRVWCLAYVGYLLLVLDPFTSLVRYLLLLFPLGALLAGVSASSAYRRAVALAFLAGQVVWVVWLWRFIPPADWPP
jgi:hypothetical protein